jgi:hypothetical protein
MGAGKKSSEFKSLRKDVQNGRVHTHWQKDPKTLPELLEILCIENWKYCFGSGNIESEREERTGNIDSEVETLRTRERREPEILLRKWKH